MPRRYADHYALARTTESVGSPVHVRDLVLLGGGHTHVLLIKALSMRPIPGVRISLISEQALTPYSGMLPGFVAGHYCDKDIMVDLNSLCRKANCRWIKGRANHLDLDNKMVCIDGHAGISFDKLSIDTGSTPDLSIKGASEFAVGVKPVSSFQQRWEALLHQVELNKSDDNHLKHWGVIGSGAGGTELVLAMAHRLREHKHLRFHLLYSGQQVLSSYPCRVQDIATEQLQRYGIELHPNFRVTEVNAAGVQSTSGDLVALDQSIWCTGAVGAAWLKASGLTISEKGFISVNQSLQSLSHPDVYAAGDVADMLDDPRPKAGVYAVRQAPFLLENLRRAFAGKPLVKVRLQTDFLSLLSLGEKKAVAVRNGFALAGAWVWRWKHRIDSQFMNQFIELQQGDMTDVHVEGPDNTMHCAGCGSKLGPQILQKNLAQLAVSPEGKLSSAVSSVEDAAVWQPSDGTKVVQSIDGFRSFSDDGYRLGQICVNHALSDIYAMGAKPVYAQAWVNLAFAHPRIQQRDHLAIMQGINDSLIEQGVVLAGGHSSEGIEEHIAIVANGELKEGKQWLKSGVSDGDVLLLTKPLGTGVILAANMQGQADASSVGAAYDSMLENNAAAAALLVDVRPHAVTDVTGFGLLGHLLEMLSGSGLQANIDLQSIPILSGAESLFYNGWHSTLQAQLEYQLQFCQVGTDVSPPSPTQASIAILLDPQTSGGLLVSLPVSAAQQVCDQLLSARVIGHIGRYTEPVDSQHLLVSGTGV